MPRLLFFCLLTLIPCLAAAQDEDECFFPNLSSSFDLETLVKENEEDSHIERITINILDKGTEEARQKLVVDIEEPTLQDIGCHAYSYTTKERHGSMQDIEAVIVGDYNFDGRDDIAVIAGFSLNGFLYKYFFQDDGGKFSEDRFLSMNAGLRPASLDMQHRQLTIQQPFNSSLVAETLFQYDTIQQSHLFFGSRFITANGSVAVTNAGFDYLQLAMPFSAVTLLYPKHQVIKQRTEGGFKNIVSDISFYGTTYDLSAWLDDSNRVAGIDIRDPRLNTQEGISAGDAFKEFSSRIELKSAFYETTDSIEHFWVCPEGYTDIRLQMALDDATRQALRGKENRVLRAEDIPGNAVVESIIVTKGTCKP